MRLIDADLLAKTIEKAQMESRKVNVLSLIHDAPTIEPTTVYEFKGCDNCELERPKGKWEFLQYDANPNIGNWHCTNCRRGAKPHTAFCPNCGARME